ncbi:MAG: histidinol-phosphate transaminase [Pseudomonadota bacterium]
MTAETKSLVRDEIVAINAYHVPPAQGLIKLDAMENPYTWTEAMREEWAQRMHNIDVNRYPDPQASALKDALRSAFTIDSEYGLVLGNGSDELIQIIATALARPGATVLAPEPSFVMYRMIAVFTGMHYIGVPLDADFNLDLDAMLSAVKREQPALTFIAYPNNPTGNLFDVEAIVAIVEASPGLVVLDEAYFPFAGASFADQLSRYPNLVVMRTVSKMGLAGLRLGYLFGGTEWLDQFEKVRLPYNINVLTQEAATFALEYRHQLDQQTDAICAERQVLSEAISAIEGCEVFPSAANFLLVRVPVEVCALHSALRNEGVLIKNLGASEGLLANCVRVTVGKPDENRALVTAMRQCVSQLPAV